MSDTTETPLSVSPEATSAPAMSHASSDDDLTTMAYRSSASSPRSAAAKMNDEEKGSLDAADNDTLTSQSREEKGKEPEHDMPEISPPSTHDHHYVAIEDVEDDETSNKLVRGTNEDASSSKTSFPSHTKYINIGPCCCSTPQEQASSKPKSIRQARFMPQAQPEFEGCVWQPVLPYGASSIPYSSPLPLTQALYATGSTLSMIPDCYGAYFPSYVQGVPASTDIPPRYRSRNTQNEGNVSIDSSYKTRPFASRYGHKSEEKSCNTSDESDEWRRAREKALRGSQEEFDQYLARYVSKAVPSIEEEVSRVIEATKEMTARRAGIEEAFRERETRIRNAILSGDERALSREEQSTQENIHLLNQDFILKGALMEEEAILLEQAYLSEGYAWSDELFFLGNERREALYRSNRQRKG